MRRSEFCADVSAEAGEPLGATASRVDAWIAVEYRGLWAHDAVDSSGLSDQVKEHLREQARALGRCKLLFVRRRDRRDASGLAVFWGTSPERCGRLFRADVEGYEDLLRLDFAAPGPPVDHPLLLVCTHGKHDRCCARRGRPLFDALAEQADDDWVWQSTHVGGDRFAGNVVCLPQGIYYGRVERGEALTLLAEHTAGRILLDRYRGRACHTFPEQAAERRVREETGLLGIDDVRHVATERSGEGWLVRFAAGRDEYEVDVAAEPGDLTYLTCASETLRAPRRYTAGSLRARAA